MAVARPAQVHDAGREEQGGDSHEDASGDRAGGAESWVGNAQRRRRHERGYIHALGFRTTWDEPLHVLTRLRVASTMVR